MFTEQEINAIISQLNDEFIKFVKKKYKKDWIRLKKIVSISTEIAHNMLSHTNLPPIVYSEIEKHHINGILIGEKEFIRLDVGYQNFKSSRECLETLLAYAFGDINWFLDKRPPNLIEYHSDRDMACSFLKEIDFLK